MQRWGRTSTGKERYFCPVCQRARTIHREDTRDRHRMERLVDWLTGVQNKKDVAKKYGLTRQALSYEFRTFFRKNPNGQAPYGFQASILIVDAKFIHGNELCALIALTQGDEIFWEFANNECYGTWYSCLVRFAPPQVVVADGQKGVSRFVKRFWTRTRFQRCHFHLVSLIIHYLSRHPKEEAGVVVLDLLYRLKRVRTYEQKKEWLQYHFTWEKQYEKVFAQKNDSGQYTHKKLRSVRSILRKALPDLFTYLDFPGCPTTTNDLEGWVNASIAESLRRHRGLHLSQKKILVSILLAHLKRENPKRTSSQKPTPLFP